MAKTKNILKYYIMLLFVCLVWGCDPVFYLHFYKNFSPSVISAIFSFGSFLMFFALSYKKLKEINIKYLKVAVPVAVISTFANLLQRIGLQYTTPAKYAFLEHIACAVVPVMMYIFIKRKPSKTQVLACIICLCGCFVLTGMSFSDLSIGIGDLLCTLAGVFGGIHLAANAVFIKKTDIFVHMTVYMFVYFIVSLFSVALLGNIAINGVAAEVVKFTLKPELFLPVLLYGLLSVGITWLMKIEAVRHINPTAVAIISPFTAVIAGVISVVMGLDILSGRLIIGAILIMCASIITSIEKSESA